MEAFTSGNHHKVNGQCAAWWHTNTCTILDTYTRTSCHDASQICICSTVQILYNKVTKRLPALPKDRSIPLGDCSPLPVVFRRQVHDDPNPAEEMVLTVSVLWSNTGRAHGAGAATSPSLLDGAWGRESGSLYLPQQILHVLQICTTWIPAQAKSEDCVNNHKGVRFEVQSSVR